ncbi:hypothetical protein PtA15_8A491 [Puccinia triticina]|uniref:Uncharacterized protein n=1 Tax=Puccinia triticina TaxID=208348 RepID=A0ABY7CUC8_9BASI|nr:uncharacterized protein PtA15_8A491 [Puccinia triticina]WAQ87587.1 hypothetical protein PtA15_8A491 [Puccinia triticina]
MTPQQININFLQTFKSSQPVHLTVSANTIFIHPDPQRPKIDNATREVEDIEMHHLEEYYSAMKKSFKDRQNKLISRLNQGQQLKEDEEEWLDGQGNLVDTKLLMT